MTPTIDEYLATPAEQEPLLLRLFQRQAALTIFDIGACEGEDSIRYSRLFPKAAVYTFEPLPGNVAKIKKHFKAYETEATIAQIALSDADGTAEFYVSSGKPEHAGEDEDWDYGNKSSSLLAPDKTLEVHPWLKFKQKVEVKTQTLAHYMAEHKIAVIDFIHMDVQGAELMVLEGAGKEIDQIKAIWLEVENIALYKDQPTRALIEDFMRDHGFVMVKSTVDAIAGDQFYINTHHFGAGMVWQLRAAEGLKRWRRTTPKLAKRVAKKAIKTVLGDSVRVRLHGGERMLVTSGMSWAFRDGQYYEKNVEHWLRQIASTLSRPVFYDIGANAGYYSLILSPLARLVYAFEPGRNTRRLLRTNIWINRRRNILINSNGLSEHEGVAEFNIYNSNGNNSLFERDIPAGHELKLLRKERVRLVSLDSLVRHNAVRPPDLIKLDIEGGELAALKGAAQTLAEHSPAILFEYSEATSRDAGYERIELLQFLAPLGYEFFGLAEDAEDNHLYPFTLESLNVVAVPIDNVLAIPDRLSKPLAAILKQGTKEL